MPSSVQPLQPSLPLPREEHIQSFSKNVEVFREEKVPQAKSRWKWVAALLIPLAVYAFSRMNGNISSSPLQPNLPLVPFSTPVHNTSFSDLSSPLFVPPKNGSVLNDILGEQVMTLPSQEGEAGTFRVTLEPFSLPHNQLLKDLARSEEQLVSLPTDANKQLAPLPTDADKQVMAPPLPTRPQETFFPVTLEPFSLSLTEDRLSRSVRRSEEERALLSRQIVALPTDVEKGLVAVPLSPRQLGMCPTTEKGQCELAETVVSKSLSETFPLPTHLGTSSHPMGGIESLLPRETLLREIDENFEISSNTTEIERPHRCLPQEKPLLSRMWTVAYQVGSGMSEGAQSARHAIGRGIVNKGIQALEGARDVLDLVKTAADEAFLIGKRIYSYGLSWNVRSPRLDPKKDIERVKNLLRFSGEGSLWTVKRSLIAMMHVAKRVLWLPVELFVPVLGTGTRIACETAESAVKWGVWKFTDLTRLSKWVERDTVDLTVDVAEAKILSHYWIPTWGLFQDAVAYLPSFVRNDVPTFIRSVRDGTAMRFVAGKAVALGFSLLARPLRLLLT